MGAHVTDRRRPPVAPVQPYAHPLSRFLRLFDALLSRRFGWIILACVLGALSLYDLLFERHDYASIAEARFFYPVIGVLAAAFVILVSWPLRALFARKDDEGASS
jgi:hypothetical protein